MRQGRDTQHLNTPRQNAERRESAARRDEDHR